MKDTSKDTMPEIENEKEEFLKTIDVRILDNADNASSFNAIVDSRKGSELPTT